MDLTMLYRRIIRPCFFNLQAETAHNIALSTLSLFRKILPLLKWSLSYKSFALENEYMGIKFQNPIGLAAGFDKDCILCDDWKHLGFGFVELGTITGEAQDGNPKPRLFRYPEKKALINRMGFNSKGADATFSHLKAKKLDLKKHKIPIGINIGKTKLVPIKNSISDYKKSFKLLSPFADYISINVSSPNTPELRKLQGKNLLHDLLSSLSEINSNNKPILLKISPDLNQQELDDIIEVSMENEVKGIIATNTSTELSLLDIINPETGGLSGAPVFDKSTAILKYLRKKVPDNFLLIGSGGINSPERAKAKLDAGANLIQIYTGYIYEGPTFIKNICKYLSKNQ